MNPGEHKIAQTRFPAYTEALFAETQDLNRITAIVVAVFILKEMTDRI